MGKIGRGTHQIFLQFDMSKVQDEKESAPFGDCWCIEGEGLNQGGVG
jgi:hypothetical protein